MVNRVNSIVRNDSIALDTYAQWWKYTFVMTSALSILFGYSIQVIFQSYA